MAVPVRLRRRTMADSMRCSVRRERHCYREGTACAQTDKDAARFEVLVRWGVQIIKCGGAL